MSKIIALCPIHRNTDLVIEQILNYERFSNNNFSHILHPSIEGRSHLNLESIEKISSAESLKISTHSWNTNFVCVMGAFLSCSSFIDQFSNNHEYIYIHTDGDLLVRSGVEKWISSHKNGFKINGTLTENCGWVHARNALLDSQLLNLKKYLDLNNDELIIGRQEGSFFTIDLWKNIVSLIYKFFPKEYFDSNKNIWPVEEVLIPTLARFLLKSLPTSKNVIDTKELIHSGGRDNDLNMVKISDIVSLRSLSSESSFGIKWFSHSLIDPARLFIKSCIAD